MKTNPVILFIAAAGLTLGCGASSGAPAATATSAEVGSASPAGAEVGEDEAGAQLVEHHRHHHGGMAMFLSMSLDSLGLSEAERQGVAKIQSDLWTKLEPIHAAQHEVLAALADGIAAGSVDKAKVDAAIAQVDAASPAAQAATSDALNQLHAALTPPQRAALAQKLEAHWQVWKQANAEGDEPASEKKHADRYAGLTRDLSLTPDEVDRIRTALHTGASDNAKKVNAADVEGRMQAFGAAFAADTFDAKSATAGQDGLASDGSRRMARFYEAVAPVLTPDQRTKLAAQLRDHAGQESGK